MILQPQTDFSPHIVCQPSHVLLWWSRFLLHCRSGGMSAFWCISPTGQVYFPLWRSVLCRRAAAGSPCAHCHNRMSDWKQNRLRIYFRLFYYDAKGPINIHNTKQLFTTTRLYLVLSYIYSTKCYNWIRYVSSDTFPQTTIMKLVCNYIVPSYS